MFHNSELSMSLPCLPSSLGSIHITIWEKKPFEEFQDGRHGAHLGCQTGMNLAVLNFHVFLMPPTKFQLNPVTVQEQISFQDFGGHLGYWNENKI